MVIGRYYDLCAADLRMLSPITDDQLAQLGRLCGLRSGQKVLDVACGKGELLCQWARLFGVLATGVDISDVFVSAARTRAAALGVAGATRFEVMDAATFVTEEETRTRYAVASCIGGCRYLGGLGSCVSALRDCIEPHGLIAVGEPYWIQPPPDEAYEAIQTPVGEYTSLVGTLDRLENAGLEAIDMIVADTQAYDRVWVPQWRVMNDWLDANPDDPDAEGLREILDGTRRAYLAWGRAYFGFVTFVCRVRQ